MSARHGQAHRAAWQRLTGHHTDVLLNVNELRAAN
jgi:hypothetical protein